MSNIGNFFKHPFESIGGAFQHPGKDITSAVKAIPPLHNFAKHPAESIGGVFKHPGTDFHSAVIGIQKNPELAALAVAVVAPYAVLAYGGAGYFAGYGAAIASGATAATPYLESAAIGTYAPGALHGFGGLSQELSQGPTKSEYMTGAEFAAAYGIGGVVDSGGGLAGRLGAGFGVLRTSSALGFDPFGAPTLGPNYTPEQFSAAQLQSDITGQPIQYTGSQTSSNSAVGAGSGGGTGAPGAGGPVTPGGGSINTTGLVALGALAFIAAEA